LRHAGDRSKARADRWAGVSAPVAVSLAMAGGTRRLRELMHRDAALEDGEADAWRWMCDVRIVSRANCSRNQLSAACPACRVRSIGHRGCCRCVTSSPSSQTRHGCCNQVDERRDGEPLSRESVTWSHEIRSKPTSSARTSC
jgi:hypothetical protein